MKKKSTLWLVLAGVSVLMIGAVVSLKTQEATESEEKQDSVVSQKFHRGSSISASNDSSQDLAKKELDAKDDAVVALEAQKKILSAEQKKVIEAIEALKGRKLTDEEKASVAKNLTAQDVEAYKSLQSQLPSPTDIDRLERRMAEMAGGAPIANSPNKERENVKLTDLDMFPDRHSTEGKLKLLNKEIANLDLVSKAMVAEGMQAKADEALKYRDQLNVVRDKLLKIASKK